MAFQKIDKFLKYIASKGNYVDITNTLVLLYNYSRVYSTGKLPLMKMLRNGKEASAVANLRRAMNGATSDTNSIHEFNKYRSMFLEYVAATNAGIYDYIDERLYSRAGIELAPTVFPVDVNDCTGSLIATANTLEEYLNIWNGQKVAADRAICNGSVDYLIDSGVAGYLIKSTIQPNNTYIPYNAPASIQHRRREEFENNRESIVDQEARVKPKSIADYNS